MSDLHVLQEKIQDTTRAMVRLEHMISQHPDLPSLAANMRSLQKRNESLRAEFLAAADLAWVDVCDYTLFADDMRPTLSGFVSTLDRFQNLFSVVYGAHREGPKDTAHLKAQLVEESTFGFAYTFTGSLGVALTARGESP